MDDYVLDFVLPIGATGPQGVEGVTGPTGPGSVKALLFLDAPSATQSGYVALSRNVLLPSNNQVFTTNGTEVYINESGNYEFTVCGTITGLTQNETLTLTLNIIGADHSPIDVTIADISATEKEAFFSQTFIYTFQDTQTVTMTLQKDNTLSSSIYNANLLIKQLAF